MGASDIVATGVLLMAVCLLRTVAPTLAGFSNGECNFNTKGMCVDECVNVCETGLSSPATTHFSISIHVCVHVYMFSLMILVSL